MRISGKNKEVFSILDETIKNQTWKVSKNKKNVASLIVSRLEKQKCGCDIAFQNFSLDLWMMKNQSKLPRDRQTLR